LNPVVATRVRAFEQQDLGRVLQLWEDRGWLPVGPDGLTVEQAVEFLRSDGPVALLAEAEGELVGTAVGVTAGAVGWLFRLALVPERAADPQLAYALLDQLEQRLAERGARKLAAVVGDGARDVLGRRGYTATPGLTYLERDLPSTIVPSALAELGGATVGPGLWEELRGMEEAKEIIERRVILPLERPELATRHAVVPPKAIVLFGPPGTGKTTFAKGIASRLGWPFVEIQPSELAGEGVDRQAVLLRRTFDLVIDLPAAVVFVDEVEDLASLRHQQRKVSPSVTNEFLKQIPRLRETPQHLLVCATNWVSRLDPAFLRPGRFDYVLPVGPPDADARGAIWRRYVEEITDQGVDVGALVGASELFTPADIEFAAREAAQRAFEREHFDGGTNRATTDDFLAAIAGTKASLSEKIAASFSEDTERFARY
jgi:transitional endoplasmic reticulum ATPase